MQPSGTRSWVQRFVIRGRRRELGLGGFPLVPLKDARAQALANRRLARAGGDPLAEKRRLKSMPTFAAAAEAVLAQMRPGWRNPKHGKDWLSSMARFTFPRLGKLPVSEVTSADVVDTLRKVWHERPATARRVRQRISTVMEWAVAMDYRDDNPCSRIIAAERCCIGRGLAGIRPNSDKTVLRDFVHWAIKHREPHLVAKAQGSTFAAIGQNDLKSLLIPLPPLDEQRRIVDILNRAARIEALRRQAVERLREFVPALFVKMFGDRNETRDRFSCRPLREVAAIASGATKGRKIEPTDAIDVPYLRVANVQDGFLTLDEIKTITIRRGEEQQYALAPGDLVMTEGGDQDKLGRAAIWNGELEYCAHQNHVFRVRPRADVVLTDYLRDVAGSAYGKSYFLSIAKRTTGIASINKTQLGGFPVPVLPLDLQRRYAETVEAARPLARVAESSTRTAVALMASLRAELLRSHG